LKENLNKLATWEDAEWMMQFNSSKCVVLPITKRKKPVQINYIICGHNLEQISSSKHRRVTITSDLKWSAHIQLYKTAVKS